MMESDQVSITRALQLLRVGTVAVRFPCFIHAGLPIEQVEIQLTRFVSGLAAGHEERSDSNLREHESYTAENHRVLVVTGLLKRAGSVLI